MGERGWREWWIDTVVALVLLGVGVTGFWLARSDVSDASVPAALVSAVDEAPPTTAGPPAPAVTTTVPPGTACHPSYQGTCIPPAVRDADCFGLGQDGPWYVRDENVRVVGPDVFGLDTDFDGVACESTPGLH
jgi:hypothetical protein